MHVHAWPQWMRFETWLPIAAICVFCWVVSVDMGYAASGGGEIYNQRMQSNSIRQMAFLGLGAVGGYLLLLARPSNNNRQIAWTILIPVVSLAAYVFASVAWSDDATMTFKRSITALLVVVAGLGMGRVWSTKQLAWSIVIVGCILLTLSVLVELRYRSFLTAGDWRFSGLFHPAKQAFNCGFLLLASLSIYFTSKRPALLLIAIAALVFLILTKARTGTAAALVAGGWLTWNFTNLRGFILVGVAGIAFVLSAVLFYQGATGREIEVSKFTTMGRDEEAADPSKLTGRLPIWTHALERVVEQPVVGYGYGAFWTTGRLDEFERLNGWALFHSHSTYLESLLNLGLIGTSLGLIVLLLVFHRSRLLTRQGDGNAALVSALLLFAAIGGFFEIAFIGLEYESIVMMASIGAMAFASSPATRSLQR